MDDWIKKGQKSYVSLWKAKQSKGVTGLIKRPVAALNLGIAFVRLYAIPAKRNAVPETSRLQPSY